MLVTVRHVAATEAVQVSTGTYGLLQVLGCLLLQVVVWYQTSKRPVLRSVYADHKVQSN